MNHGAMNHGGMAMDHSQHAAAAGTGRAQHYCSPRSHRVWCQHGHARGHGAQFNLDDRHRTAHQHRRVLTSRICIPRRGRWTREALAEVELHLTGNTWNATYGPWTGWSSKAHAGALKHGERLRVILHNDTMMTHPMHCIGMSELEAPDGRFLCASATPCRQPAITHQLPGDSRRARPPAVIRHPMFHMDAGMFREVVVSRTVHKEDQECPK